MPPTRPHPTTPPDTANTADTAQVSGGVVVDGGERGGASSVEMALLWSVLLTCLLAIVQVALLSYAGQVALSAAQDGLRTGRAYGTTDVAAVARRDAEEFLARAGGTLLTLTQSDLPSFAEILSDTAGPRGELQTFWTLSISNLFDHLSGRELTPRCDYTSPELRGSVVIDAAPDAVFDSLTQSEHLDRWMGAKVDVEPRVGGRFAMGGFDVDPGGIKFSEFEPGRKATLRFADGLTSSWELDGSEGRTRLTFVQSGFDVGNPPYPGWAGWLAGVADLRRYHELPRWRTLLRRIEAPGVPDEMFSIDA